MPPAGRAPRLVVWVRASILGTVVMLVGSVAHVSAGGLLPGATVLAAMLVAGVVSSAWFLERRASTVKLALLVIGGQSLVHLGLSVTAGHRSGADLSSAQTAAPEVSPALDGHSHTHAYSHSHALPETLTASSGAGGFGAPADGAGAFGHLVEHLLEQGPLMLLAHVAAAAAVGAWLAVGERALWALLAVGWARLSHLVRACQRALAWWAGAGSTPPGVRQATYAASVGFLPAYRLAHRATATRGPPGLRTA